MTKDEGALDDRIADRSVLIPMSIGTAQPHRHHFDKWALGRRFRHGLIGQRKFARSDQAGTLHAALFDSGDHLALLGRFGASRADMILPRLDKADPLPADTRVSPSRQGFRLRARKYRPSITSAEISLLSFPLSITGTIPEERALEMAKPYRPSRKWLRSRSSLPKPSRRMMFVGYAGPDPHP
jgi:hypothetical protein